MIDLSIKFSFSNPNTTALKKWEEDPMPADSFSAKLRGDVGQFSFIPFYIIDANGKWCGDWSANNNFSYLTHNDMMALADMQIADEFTVEQKMNWLTWDGLDQWGSPMRCVPVNGTSTKWSTAKYVKSIGAAWAGQRVEVIGHKTFTVNYNDVIQDVPMSEMRMFSRADWGKTHKDYPHLVQKVTVVDRANRYGESPKGTIYMPVGFGTDFDFAGNFIPAKYYVFDRWLKELV